MHPPCWTKIAFACATAAVAITAEARNGSAQAAAAAIIVADTAAQRNPVTEFAVDFGDVKHLSPWKVRRRFPRSGGAKGGQLVTVRDAMEAVNAFVAKDDEMPEHSFTFSADGALVSICDVPFALDGGKGGKCATVRVDGAAPAFPDMAAFLSAPVRDFARMEFVMAGAKGGAAKTVGLPTSGKTKTITLPGGAAMEMIWCEPGTFMMGSPATEVGRFEDEPLHRVTLTKGFWLGKYEVTQHQWQSVMGSNPARFKGDDFPVESVSWEDCQEFIHKVNAVLPCKVRLPTEAEWEYACRAGSGAAVSGSGTLDEMAWYDANSDSRTHSVGKNQANAWGFYDMHGNVLEWCADWFGKSDAQSVDPKGPPVGTFRVLRGGCWFFYARDCRSAYRLKRDPALRNAIYGFRIASSEK